MKKSKVTIGLLLAMLALSVTTAVYAVEGTSTKTKEEVESYRAEMREEKATEIEKRKAEYTAEREKKAQEREAKQTELRTEREAKLAEQKTEREQRRAEKLAKFIEVLVEKVGKYYDRLSQLSEKLQTRITKLKEDGIDMAAAQAKLDEADKALEAAYQNALAIIEEIKGSDISLEDGLGTVISKVKELKNPFRSVLEAYKEVAKEIRAAVSETRKDDVEVNKESNR